MIADFGSNLCQFAITGSCAMGTARTPRRHLDLPGALSIAREPLVVQEGVHR